MLQRMGTTKTQGKTQRKNPELSEMKITSKIAPDAQPDDTPQRMMALDTQRSFLVEASAGSGKTELLIQRYLKLLAQVEEPEEILAITFTRKAAAEMRDRILQELRAAEKTDASSEPSPHKQQTRALAAAALENGRRRNWNLTRQPHRMQVRTIDSLCKEITSRLPMLAQMEERTQPITDASELYSIAAQNVLKQLGGDDEKLNTAIRALLLHLDNRLEHAVQLLANLLATRDQWGHIFPIAKNLSDAEFDNALRERFELPFLEIRASACDALAQVMNPAATAQIFSFIQHAAGYLKKAGKKNPFAACLAWTELPLYRAEDAVHWAVVADFLLTREGGFRKKVDVTLGFPPNDPRKPEMQALLTSLTGNTALQQALRDLQMLPPAQYTEQQRKVLRASFLLLRHALVQLKLVFAQEGKTDFTELLLAAQQALADDTNSIALALGTKIQHLLVDEMQDTSVTQFHLLRHLTQSWDGFSQTVFLVGDPKQSIYRFRQAEVALFAHARDSGLGDVRFETIFLTSNFRSQQRLVETTNQYFSQVFLETNDTDGIHFHPSLAANLEESIDKSWDRVHWHPLIHAKQKEKSESARKSASDAIHPSLVEAQTLCDVIEGYRSEDQANDCARSIAILVSNKRHAWPILKEMQRRKIPYCAIEMDTLTDRQSLLDLLAITRCLLHAADRTAWLAVLRAPWCGLTLADLHTLCGTEVCGTEDAQWRSCTFPELLRERLSLLSDDGQQRAARVWRTLEQACSLLPQERMSSLVERAWHTLGGQACVLASEMPAIEQFFAMLSDLEMEGVRLTATRIEERMQKLYAPTPAPEEGSVEVLTMHKAKGLEWDIVLLPGLHNKPRNDDPRLLVWEEDIRPTPEGALKSQFFLAPIQHVSETKEPFGQWIRQRIAKREKGERKRLLYVACTRARRELHLFATLAQNEKGELARPNARSLLHIAWPLAAEIFARQPEQTNVADNILTMPAPHLQPHSGIAASLAAEAQPGEASILPLSNFRRLPSGWTPTPLPPDVGQPSDWEQVEAATEDAVSAILRPEGSWKARLFGTVVHALMQPLAQILRASKNEDAVNPAVQHLRQPALLRMMQGGYAPKAAQVAADRIARVLLEISRDPVAQWLLAAHPNVDPLLPDFEIPLTALRQKTIRNVRLDRMFLAGPEPLAAGNQHLWIVDFKTATHGERDMEPFLAEQKNLYTRQMQVYAEVARAAYPQPKEIHLGLYYPLLQKFIWWIEGAT